VLNDNSNGVAIEVSNQELEVKATFDTGGYSSSGKSVRQRECGTTVAPPSSKILLMIPISSDYSNRNSTWYFGEAGASFTFCGLSLVQPQQGITLQQVNIRKLTSVQTTVSC